MTLEKVRPLCRGSGWVKERTSGKGGIKTDFEALARTPSEVCGARRGLESSPPGR
jgi:hypothetical protein